MSRTYARLDQATLGSQLLLQEGGLVVTFDTDGASLNRNARSNQGVDIGLHYWEVIAGGTLPLAGNVSAGIVDVAVATNQQVGNVSDSYGYTGDGDMLAAGATVDTVAAPVANDVIGFALDVDPTTPTLAVYLNSLLLYTFSLPTGKTWHPAVSIGGATALELSAFVNLGKREFEKTPPDDYRPGIFIDDAGISLLVAPEGQDYITRPDDSPPNVRYEGRILNPGQFSFKTGARPWTHAQRGGTASFSDLDLDNRDGHYDSLLADPPRGSRIVLRRIMAGELLSDPDATLVALLDDVTAPNNSTVRLHLKSILSLYKVPLRRQTYTPFVADGAANRVKPISLGACRNVPAVLVDPINRRYDAHDAAMTQIAAVRDRGDILDPSATPPDYVPTGDLRGINLEVEPVGKLTMDVSSQGDSSLTPPPLSDALEGYGDMTNDVGGMPERWLLRDSTAFVTASWLSSGRLEVRADGMPVSSVQGFSVQYEDQSTSLNFIPIRKNVRYKLTISIPAVRWPTVADSLQYLYASLSAPTQSGLDLTRQLIWSESSVAAVGTFEASFLADRDGTLELFGSINYDTTHSGDAGWVALPWWITFDDITVEAITTVPLDRLEGYGQFDSGLTRWNDGGTTGASSYGYVSLTTGSYTMGRIQLNAKGADVARVIYDSGATASGAPLFVAGQHYRIAWTATNVDSDARLNVINQTAGGDVILGTYSADGENELIFTASDDGELVLEVYDDSGTGSAPYFLSYLRVLDTTDQEAEGVPTDDLAGITLADYFNEILVKRHGADASAYNTADLEAIDDETGYVFGVHIPDAINVDDALQLPLDSFGACLSDGGDGTIRVARLIAPEDVGDSEGVEFEFTRTNMFGPPDPQSAMAPGLTTNFGCRRNWTVFSSTDFVDDYDPVTGIDAATRERFKRISQYIVAAATDLHAMYRDAQDAGELSTLLDRVVHAQTEVDRIAAIFAICRRLYILKAKTESAPPALRFGSIVKCTYPRYGFDAGKNLIVFEATRYMFRNRIEVLALC